MTNDGASFTGFTVIVNFLKSAVDAEFSKIDAQLKSVWQDAGMIRTDTRTNETSDGQNGESR